MAGGWVLRFGINSFIIQGIIFEALLCRNLPLSKIIFPSPLSSAIFLLSLFYSPPHLLLPPVLFWTHSSVLVSRTLGAQPQTKADSPRVSFNHPSSELWAGAGLLVGGHQTAGG